MLRVGDPRGWWLLALAALFLLVLVQRGRRRREPSSIFFLIRRLAAGLSVSHRRLRLLRRVALALFAAAAVATAVASLDLQVLSAARARRDLLVLDLSPSLGVEEGGRARLELLRRHLGRYLDQLGEEDAAVVVTAGPQAAATPELGPEALRSLVSALDHADAPADVAGAARLAASLGRARAFDHVLLFTDRAARWQGPGIAPALAALGPRLVTFGAPAANAGIEAIDLEADPQSPELFDVYLRVGCTAPAPGAAARDLALTLRNNERELRRVALRCPPGEPRELLLEDLALERGRFEARLEPGDAYAADDRAVAGVSDAPAAKVVLVSPGNRFLQAALEALPGIELEARGADSPLQPDARAVYVVDGAVPAGPLPDKALFIQPDRALDALAPETWRTYPERVAWERDDPLLRGVDLEGLSVKSFAAYGAVPGFAVAATADGWPLVLRRDGGGRRWVVLAFNPAETNLVYTSSYPVLIAGAVRWLSLFTASERPYFRVGEPVHLPAAARGGAVHPPAGPPLAIPAGPGPAAPFFETRHPGAYRVSAPGGAPLGSFFVNVADPAVSASISDEGYGRGPAELPAERRHGPLRRESAPVLALLAIALLAAERFLAAAQASQREA